MAINRSGVYEATDQASLTFVESQAAKIEARVRPEVMAKVRYPELVRMYTDIDPAHDSLVSYISRPGTGKMGLLSVLGHDQPQVDVEYDELSRKQYDWGVSYSYTDREIQRAMLVRTNLAADKVKAAYEVGERHKEDLVLNGSNLFGWNGLITNRNASCITMASHAEWATGDTTVPFETIRQAFNAVYAGSSMVEAPDTLLLPVKAATYLNTMIKVDGSVTTMSVWEYIRRYNPYTQEFGRPLMMKMINELDRAGPSNTPMAVLYNSSVDVLRFVMAEDLNFMAPQREGYYQRFYGRMNTGGLQILRPKAICYITGIGTTE